MPQPPSDGHPTTSPHPVLAQKTVWITRSADSGSQSFTHILKKAGASVLEVPVVTIESIPLSEEQINTALKADWLVFTSKNGIRHFFNQAKDVIANTPPNIAVLGENTATHLKQYGLNPDFVGSGNGASVFSEELLAYFSQTDDRPHNLAWPCGNLASHELIPPLDGAGHDVNSIAVYQTESLDANLIHNSHPQLSQNSTIDIVALTSPSAVRAYHQYIQPYPPVKQPLIACIGETTGAEVNRLLGNVDIQPENPSIISLADSIAQHFTTR